MAQCNSFWEISGKYVQLRRNFLFQWSRLFKPGRYLVWNFSLSDLSQTLPKAESHNKTGADFFDTKASDCWRIFCLPLFKAVGDLTFNLRSRNKRPVTCGCSSHWNCWCRNLMFTVISIQSNRTTHSNRNTWWFQQTHRVCCIVILLRNMEQIWTITSNEAHFWHSLPDKI